MTKISIEIDADNRTAVVQWDGHKVTVRGTGYGDMMTKVVKTKKRKGLTDVEWEIRRKG